MKFKAGDAIVHPVRGAGVVIRIEERKWGGNIKQYYRIELLGQPMSSLMIPISAVEEIGVRHATSESGLKKVWGVLLGKPKDLPSDHKKRYELLDEKLHGGSIIQVTEVVRDMAWRRQHEGRLTTVGKRIYDESVLLLAGEVAAARGVPLSDAEGEIRSRLRESLEPAVEA